MEEGEDSDAVLFDRFGFRRVGDGYVLDDRRKKQRPKPLLMMRFQIRSSGFEMSKV